MSRPLGVAIVGCGVISTVHAGALRLDDAADLRWAIDPVAEAASRLGVRFQSADLRPALDDPAVDLVIICTPHHLHAAQADAALAAGKHVLCEKPLATTPDDIDAMVACANRHPALAAGVCFQHRFNPLVRRLAELVHAGDLGPITAITVDFACTREQAYYASGPWRGRWDGEGGGTLINQAIHIIDLACWIGGRPTGVRADLARRRLADPVEVEDHANLDVAFSGGHHAAMRIANDGVTPWRTELTVQTADALIRLGAGYRLTRCAVPSRALAAELAALSEASRTIACIPGIDAPGKPDYGDFHRLAVADILAAIRAGRPPRVTFADAAPANQVVLGAYAAAACGGPVTLPARPFRRPLLT